MTSYTSSTATVDVDIPNNWNSGFVANFSITAEQAISGWQLEIQFSGNIQNIWGARIVSHVGDTYVIEGLNWNANIAEGSTQSFGFVGAGSPEDLAPNSINGDGFGDDTNDVVAFPGNRDDYTITQIDDVTVEITGPEGSEVYSDVTTFEFADITQTFEELIVPRLANLDAAEIDVSDTSLAPDETTTITVEIASNGTLNAGASSAELVVASDPNGTTIIGSYGSVDLSAIATGENTTATFDFDPGDLAPGTYWVAVRVDSGDVLTEEDETDNLTQWVEVTVEEPIADLILLEAGLGDRTDLDLEDGGQIEIDYVIENASNDHFSYLSARTYLSTDAVISDDDMLITGITGGTRPGLIHSPSTIHYFQEDFAPGEYYLISVVKWGDGTEDATPEDNILIQTITFLAPPEPVIDIAVTGIEVLTSSDLEIGFGGGTLDLAITLENLGNISSLAGLTVTLSTDGTASTDDLTLWTGSADVAEGTAFTLNISAALDEALAAGDFTIFVTANTANDGDLGNNIALAAVQLTEPVNPGTEGDDIWISGDTPASVNLLGGNDTAIAGLQSDVVDGGAGFDTVDFSQITEGMDFYINAFDPSLGIQAAPHSTFTLISGWTNFEEIVGTSFDDNFSLNTVESGLVINAGAGNDIVEDGAGDDIILLGAGDDMVFNWLGDDTITTGDGSDLVLVIRDTDGTYFDFESGSAGSGHDVVLDFDISEDLLLVWFTEDEDYDPFDDLTQTADGALLSYADDSSILLVGVDIADLSASNFTSEQDSDPIVGSI